MMLSEFCGCIAEGVESRTDSEEENKTKLLANKLLMST